MSEIVEYCEWRDALPPAELEAHYVEVDAALAWRNQIGTLNPRALIAAHKRFIAAQEPSMESMLAEMRAEKWRLSDAQDRPWSDVVHYEFSQQFGPKAGDFHVIAGQAPTDREAVAACLARARAKQHEKE